MHTLRAYRDCIRSKQIPRRLLHDARLGDAEPARGKIIINIFITILR